MLRFIFTKIKNKYRLYLALLAGVISMIAVCGVIMMLRKGSLDRLIQSEFTSYNETEGKFPSVVSRTGSVILDSDEDAAETALSGLKSYFENQK